MATEIGNFECSQCGEPIPYADLGSATATLSRDHKGIVIVCTK